MLPFTGVITYYTAPPPPRMELPYVYTHPSPRSPPPLKLHIPGVLISTQLHLHPDPLIPAMHIASFYGPHSLKVSPT